jgi:hypothetical protein
MPGSTALPIDWISARRSAGTYDNADKLVGLRPFIAANRADIDSLRLPVLLFADAGLNGQLRIFAHGDFYSLSSIGGGVAVTLTGYGRAYPLPASADTQLPSGGLRSRMPTDGLVIEAGEAGLDVDFNRFGAAYSLSIQCDEPEGDKRCSDQTYVRGLVDRMGVVIPGGGG